MVPYRDAFLVSRESGLARGPAAAAAPDQYGSAAPRRQRRIRRCRSAGLGSGLGFAPAKRRGRKAGCTKAIKRHRTPTPTGRTEAVKCFGCGGCASVLVRH